LGFFFFVFVFLFFLFCVPYVDSFSGLSIFDSPFGVL
jgi:quinol-cytochrome oxidoreductase complex cytochrome b subunit